MLQLIALASNVILVGASVYLVLRGFRCLDEFCRGFLQGMGRK